MADKRIPAVAAAIAYVDLNAHKHGWKNAAELWGEIDDNTRREYRAMARAALAELDTPIQEVTA